MQIEIKQNSSQAKKDKVIRFRISYQDYDKYETRCLELQQPMSKFLRDSVRKIIAGDPGGGANFELSGQ